jgi:preflagellin peptidase FlaK
MLADLVRVATGTAVLLFASWTDLQWRRAPNHLWWIVAAVGLAVLAGEAVADAAVVVASWPYLVAAPAFAALVFAFWRLGLLAGGADAKALASLALLLPFPIQLGPGVPLLPSPMPGAFTVMGDSLLVLLALPALFLVRNLVRGDLRFPALLLGYRLPLEEVPETWCWPMEHPDPDGGTRFSYLPSRGPTFTRSSLETLEEQGVESIWVTPKIPYMVPLAVGFLLAFTVGDVLYAGLELFL